MLYLVQVLSQPNHSFWSAHSIYTHSTTIMQIMCWNGKGSCLDMGGGTPRECFLCLKVFMWLMTCLELWPPFLCHSICHFVLWPLHFSVRLVANSFPYFTKQNPLVYQFIYMEIYMFTIWIRWSLAWSKCCRTQLSPTNVIDFRGNSYLGYHIVCCRYMPYAIWCYSYLKVHSIEHNVNLILVYPAHKCVYVWKFCILLLLLS